MNDSTSSESSTPAKSRDRPPRKRPPSIASSIFGWFSVSNIAIAIFLAYVGMVATNLHRIMNPIAYLPPITDETSTLDPLWPQDMPIDVHCYIR